MYLHKFVYVQIFHPLEWNGPDLYLKTFFWLRANGTINSNELENRLGKTVLDFIPKI